jgi:hypothetical protein
LFVPTRHCARKIVGSDVKRQIKEPAANFVGLTGFNGAVVVVVGVGAVVVVVDVEVDVGSVVVVEVGVVVVVVGVVVVVVVVVVRTVAAKRTGR